MHNDSPMHDAIEHLKELDTGSTTGVYALTPLFLESRLRGRRDPYAQRV
jgi:hypothetical protein